MHIGAAAFIAAIGFVLVQASGCLGESSPVASSACTPGEAVACVGLGGCSGGQRCNAQGNGYDDCQCAVDNDGGDGETSDAADDHPKDSGAADAAQLPPTSAGLHLTFAITRSNDTPTTCAAETSIASIAATLTPSGSDGSTEDSFVCGLTGDVTGLSFGSYVLVVEAVNSGNLSLGRSSSQNVVLDGTSCDSMSGTDCVKNLAVAIKLD